MSTIATVTVPAIILHLKGDDGFLGEFIDEFLDILEEHQDFSDPLSINLANWGEELANFLANEVSLDVDSIALKLHELEKIVINPLDGSPIEHPRIAGGRIWEEWMLVHIQTLFENSSCYSDETSIADVKVHSFAERLLRWKDKIFISSHPKLLAVRKELERLKEREDKAGWLDREECLRSRPHVAIAGYVELAINSDRLQLLTDVADRVGKAATYFTRVMKASEERTKMHLEATRVSLVEGERRLKEDLDEIRSIYTRTIRSLRTSLEEARRENIALEGRVAYAEGRISDLSARISSLEARVQSAEAQNYANMNAARSSGGGCIIM